MAERTGQKYRFARDATGSVLDVTRLTERPKGITCLGCGGAMSARMGRERVHHFAHKSLSDCSPETYRHILAKNVFLLRYKQAVREAMPFLVELSHPLVCAAHDRFPMCPEDFGTTPRAWDLTHHYDVAHLEKQHGPYVADVLLSNLTDPARVLFVEMCVTHASTEEKTQFARMIEIDVFDENRIDDFDSFCIREGTFRTYNIKLGSRKAEARCLCRERAEREQAEEEAARLARWHSRELQRRPRQGRKEEQSKYAQFLQSQTEFTIEMRNTGEWQAGGPFILVGRNRSRRRKLPPIAFITSYLTQGDANCQWHDHERGITIRCERRNWKPYIVEVENDRISEFQRLDEAIAYYFSIAG